MPETDETPIHTSHVWVNVHSNVPNEERPGFDHLVKVWSGEQRITVAEFSNQRDAAIFAARLADRNDWRPEHKRPLNEVMEFEHVIEVLDDGLIIDRPDLYAPELHEGELLSDDWSLFTDGYTGQQGGGAIMHNSEYIGGRLEKDIRSTPGVYVALVCNWDPGDDEDDDEDAIEGWAIAHHEAADSPTTT